MVAWLKHGYVVVDIHDWLAGLNWDDQHKSVQVKQTVHYWQVEDIVHHYHWQVEDVDHGLEEMDRHQLDEVYYYLRDVGNDILIEVDNHGMEEASHHVQ